MTDYTTVSPATNPEAMVEKMEIGLEMKAFLVVLGIESS
jgi:hypothetical protein